MTSIVRYGPPMLEHLELVHQGKARDTYRAKWPNPSDQRRPPLCMVVTDRISTHNIVHKSAIPKKGEVLTALTVWWIGQLERAQPLSAHLVAAGKHIYEYLPGAPSDYPPGLHHRAIVVKHLDMIPVEFIYRARLGGSLWDKYYSKGIENPYGIKLEPGLPLMYRFTRPIFTPTKKSETDEPLNHLKTYEKYGMAAECGRLILERAQRILKGPGLEVIDTKFEFGLDEDKQTILADEVLTPDSSRFARRNEIHEGENPPWFDKQVARDWAEKHWGLRPKVPLVFPPLVVHQLKENYLDLCEMVTGMPLSKFQSERLS